jgi:tetratricopeptide (TPR) repeat protein
MYFIKRSEVMMLSGHAGNTEKNRFRGYRVAISFVFFLLASSYLFATSQYDQGLKLYRQTNFSAAIEMLRPSAKTDAAASALTGQSYFMLGEFTKATESLEQAVLLDPSKSTYFLWLGRAYGRRAETAFPVAAPRYASKAKTNLEKALMMNPSDCETASDLFEYYLQAPGILGGGFDKAAVLAEKIAERDPAEGLAVKARLAEERKDFSTAEALLRRGIEIAPHQPGRFLDLARFLAKHSKYEESDATFREARKFAPEAPRVLFQEAATYIKANRKKEESRELLMRYISSTVSPDDPSKREAEALLRKVSGT